MGKKKQSYDTLKENPLQCREEYEMKDKENPALRENRGTVEQVSR